MLPIDAAPDLPWKELAGGGAVVAVIGVMVFMLKWAGEHLKAIAAEFSATTKDANAKNKENAETFAETTTTLVKEARDAHAKCEETIHGILRDHLNGK